jgi:predicted HTH domain antitoxin
MAVWVGLVLESQVSVEEVVELISRSLMVKRCEVVQNFVSKAVVDNAASELSR